MKFHKTKDIKKFEKKSHKKLYFSIILSSFFLLMLAFFIYGIYQFFTTYAFRSPVLFQNPIYKIKADVIITPMASPSGKTTRAEFDLSKIADKIYTLESSNGKNDGCRNLGLYNGYGYRQNSFEHICFSSHEEVRQLVITWLTKHIKDGDIASALCMYNQGKVTNQCKYAINYNSL